MSVTVTVTPQQSWFAPKLRAALDRQQISVRALARAWRPDGDVETSRRSLNRYLNKGIVPAAQTRQELASALGLEAHELEPDEDEEGSMLRFSLDDFLHIRIRQILRQEGRR